MQRMTLSWLATLLLTVTSANAQTSRGQAEITIDGNKMSIDYGQPLLRGRDMLSRASVGTVWRLGMNEATEIDSEADMVIEGTELKAGKYSLWAKMVGESEWVLAFHELTGIWGQPELSFGHVAELPLKLETASEDFDQLTIDLQDRGDSVEVTIHWGTTVLTGAIVVQ